MRELILKGKSTKAGGNEGVLVNVSSRGLLGSINNVGNIDVATDLRCVRGDRCVRVDRCDFLVDTAVDLVITAEDLVIDTDILFITISLASILNTSVLVDFKVSQWLVVIVVLVVTTDLEVDVLLTSVMAVENSCEWVLICGI